MVVATVWMRAIVPLAIGRARQVSMGECTRIFRADGVRVSRAVAGPAGRPSAIRRQDDHYTYEECGVHGETDARSPAIAAWSEHERAFSEPCLGPAGAVEVQLRSRVRARAILHGA